MTTGDTGPVGGPTLTMGGAVRATGISRSTMQRRLADGSIPGAHRTEAGEWSIPYAGLVAANLIPKVTPPDPTPTGPMSEPEPEPVRDPAELVTLRAEVVRLRAELDTATALAAERARHLDDLREALAVMGRALPAGDATEPVRGSSTPTPPVRRRWFARNR